MPQTKAGAAKAMQTLIDRLGGPEAYREWRRRVGELGGTSPKTRPAGFAAMTKAQRKKAGRKGGRTTAQRRIERQEDYEVANRG